MSETVDWTKEYHQDPQSTQPSPSGAPIRSDNVGGRSGSGCLKFGIIGLVQLLAVAGIGGCAALGIRNGLVSKDEDVKAQWSNIDAQLTRRADLIPNLVSTVKGYAKHEEGIFKAVADARSKLMAAGPIVSKAEADAELHSALSRLLAISENYPDLKANENFVRLQDELAGTENRIGVARTRYNETVKEFNASLRKFPGALFVPGLGLKPAEYFQPPAGKDVQTPPSVQF